MRQSIFEIENRLDINKEFENLVSVLNEDSTIHYNHEYLSVFRFLNKYIFSIWEYRDTFIDLGQYLNHIGISDSILNGIQNIKEVNFLNFLELILNLMYTADKTIGIDKIVFNSIRAKNIVFHNVPIILEKMNYKFHVDGDKVLIIKRDADVDSVLNLVPDDISALLLSYNDIRNNNIEDKKTILKKLDLFIDSNKKELKSYDDKLFDSIGTVVNKMGINHPIKEKPFCDLSDKDLITWYDNCFKMMIHLIRAKEIINIKKERNDLLNGANEVKA